MTSTDRTKRPDRDLGEMLLREVDGWTYHVASLDSKDTEVRTVELDRPVGLARRLAAGDRGHRRRGPAHRGPYYLGDVM